MKLLNVDTIEEVQAKLKKYFGGSLAPVEEVPLFQAAGRFLAEEIRAEEDVPAFSRAVVDGYAVVAADTFGVGDAAPVFLKITGAVEMGRGFDRRVDAGQAVYVPTGGVLPEGADAVVMVEFTELLDEGTVAVCRPAAPGSGVMARGEDFPRGQLLYEKGHRLAVTDVGLLAAIGKPLVQVYKPPQVAVISTGDELVSVADRPGPGQVRDVNAYTLAALVEGSGGRVSGVYMAGDTEETLRETVETARRNSSIVLLSGGSSAGEKDMTAAVIDSLGEPGVFTHGMAMKPGKPTIIGAVQGCCGGGRPDLLVGLPGHPMAAVIAYKVVVDHFIKKHCFGAVQQEISVPAQLTENVRAGDGRETFVLVRLRKEATGDGQWLAEPIFAKSGAISQLRDADGYVRISHLTEGRPKGALVQVTLL